MSDSIFDVPLNQLERYVKGEPLVEAKLNASIDVLNRAFCGVEPPSQVIPPRNPAAFNLGFTRFIIADIQGDYLISNGGTRIAKNYYNRVTPFNGLTDADGITYFYDDVDSRTATDADENTENQVVDPPYRIGDMIFAITGIDGGTGVVYTNVSGETVAVDYLDINNDGRRFVKDNS